MKGGIIQESYHNINVYDYFRLSSLQSRRKIELSVELGTVYQTIHSFFRLK